MMELLLKIAAGALAGTAGALGLGGGGVLLLYLTLFAGVDQLRAQGVNLIFFIPCALVSLFFHRREGRLDLRAALLFGSLGLLGALLGYLISSMLDPGILRKLLGGFMLALGVYELLLRKRETKAEPRG